MCSFSTSSSWKPTLNTGLSDVIGSWKIIEISAPRMSRSSGFDRLSRSRPSNSTRLPGWMIEFSGGSRPSSASDVTLLPDPDSPTSATVELRGTSKEIPFTASNDVSLSRRKLTRRSRTWTSGGSLLSVAISAPPIP